MLSQMPVASFQGQTFSELLRRQRMAQRVYEVSEQLLLSQSSSSRSPRQVIPGAGNLLTRDRLPWEQVFGLFSHLPPIPILPLTRCFPQRQQSPSWGTIPLGWRRISTGRSKVCLLAKVMMMLLAECAEGAASARIS